MYFCVYVCVHMRTYASTELKSLCTGCSQNLKLNFSHRWDEDAKQEAASILQLLLFKCQTWTIMAISRVGEIWQALCYMFPSSFIQPSLWLLWLVCGLKLHLPSSAVSQNRLRKFATMFGLLQRGCPIFNELVNMYQEWNTSSTLFSLQYMTWSGLFYKHMCLSYDWIWGQTSLLM